MRHLFLLLLPFALLYGAGAACAQARSPLRTVRYHGYAVRIPRSWAVYRLARHSRACVRFDRHALYLGTPGRQQLCPGHVAGRTEAILIAPAAAAAAPDGASTAGVAPAERLGGSVTTFAVPAAGVQVTATWSRDRGLVARALHRWTLPAPPRARPAPSVSGAKPSARAARGGVRARAASVVFTGLGFDACSAPSPNAMSAWGSSPYRAIGIYIGGANAACAQPNLTATWTSTEVAAGWHLIPTYVGLQAPTNSCGCAAIIPAQATAQGTAAADDAMTDAQSLGLPAGNPIYDDMESYPRGSTNSSAVLAFLSAWTAELHAKGYLSGVYSSADSGVTDLVNAFPTGYLEPDDLWIADWNGQQSTSDPAVPASEWANHQRIHQYRGGHNEKYGGVTINIDNNYLDGATADTAGGAPPPPPPPTLAVSATSDGTTMLSAKWSAGTGLASWRALAGTSVASLTAVGSAPAHGSAAQFALHTAAPFFAVQALGSAGQLLANSSTVATPAHIVLYGHTIFVSQSTGIGGVPAGCYTGGACHIATSIWVGRTLIARTGTEAVPPGSTGILYFKLTSRGRVLLTSARGARLGAQVISRDVSGRSGTATFTLIPFSTSGRGPARSVTQSDTVRIMGFTDFVYARGAGGLLAACVSIVSCRISATLSVGRTTIATTQPETVGGNEAGYLFFSLTPAGRAMLDRAVGNQLGARVRLTSGTSTASATVALVQFN